MSRKKILLVDDSSTILLMERMILGKGPYELVTASDGLEAISKAITEEPHLILMDVVMPHMTGFEACRQIRAQERTRNTPIIMVTTRCEAQNAPQGVDNCSDFLMKPINGVELLTKVRSVLGE